MAQRGRPPVFVGALRQRIVGLIEKHGATGARERLANYKRPISISMPTLLGIAADAGVELRRGRRVAA